MNCDLKKKCYELCQIWADLSVMVDEIESEESDFCKDDFTKAVKETYDFFTAVNQISEIPFDTFSGHDVRDISYLTMEISMYKVYAVMWENRYSKISAYITELLLDLLLLGIQAYDENGLLTSYKRFEVAKTGKKIKMTYDVEKGNIEAVIKALYPDLEV